MPGDLGGEVEARDGRELVGRPVARTSVEEAIEARECDGDDEYFRTARRDIYRSGNHECYRLLGNTDVSGIHLAVRVLLWLGNLHGV